MNSYVIFTIDGNGYSCNCCRRESEGSHIMDFATDAELSKYIEDYNKQFTTNVSDSKIVRVYKLADKEPVFEKI